MAPNWKAPAAVFALVLALLACSPVEPTRRTQGLAEPELAIACVFAVNCDTPLQPRYRDVTDCMASNQLSALNPELPGPRAVRTSLLSWANAGCLASAPSCSGALPCLVDPVRCAGLFDGGTAQAEPQCVGNSLVSCSPGVSLTQSCGALDSECMTLGGVAACGQFACPADAETTRCDGNILVRCVVGFGTEIDCSASNRGCRIVDGLSQCAGVGPECTSSRCEEGGLVLCDHGREWRVQCKQGESCVAQGGDVKCQPRKAPECDPSSWVDHCDGSRLVVCDGAVQRIDCTQFGFGGCVERGPTDAGACR